MKNLFKHYFLFFAFLWVVSSCTKTTEPDPTPQNQFLLSSTAVGEFTKEQLIQRAADPTLALFLRNGIKVYKLTYKTKNTDGKDITASGLVLYPSTSTAAMSMLSVQHGTITNDAEAPSYFANNSEANAAGSLLASLGYIIVYPDYIGYGASKDVPHPYEHRASLASSSLDMIRAAREFVTEQKINWDKKLYLTGYSQGGFATMSLLKKIEEEVPTEFNLRAVSCGSGAYDKTSFMKTLVTTKTHGIANYNSMYLWVLLTYDRLYNLNRPMTSYFKEPWAGQITTNKQKVNVNVSLNTIMADAFVKSINDGSDAAFANAVKDNDVYDWKPKTPLRLYHGDADQLVFYANSVAAEKAMKAKGATSVTLLTMKGKDHTNGLTDYLLGTYEFFSSTP
jgi:dienelactone hydrolase